MRATLLVLPLLLALLMGQQGVFAANDNSNSWRHLLGEAASTFNPRLWDVADPGATSQTQTGGPLQGGKHSGHKDTALEGLLEAYNHAVGLIRHAAGAVSHLDAAADAEAALHDALHAYHAAEAHVLRWGAAILHHHPAGTAGLQPAPVATATSTTSAHHSTPELRQHLRSQGGAVLRSVVQQLQQLLPPHMQAGSDSDAAHHTGAGACLDQHSHASGNPADDILRSVHCLEQLIASLEAGSGGEYGSVAATAAASGGGNLVSRFWHKLTGRAPPAQAPITALGSPAAAAAAEGSRHAMHAAQQGASQLAQGAGDAGSAVADAARDAAATAIHTAATAGQSVRNTAHHTAGVVAGAAGSAGQALHRAAGAAKGTVSHAGHVAAGAAEHAAAVGLDSTGSALDAGADALDSAATAAHGTAHHLDAAAGRHHHAATPAAEAGQHHGAIGISAGGVIGALEGILSSTSSQLHSQSQPHSHHHDHDHGSWLHPYRALQASLGQVKSMFAAISKLPSISTGPLHHRHSTQQHSTGAHAERQQAGSGDGIDDNNDGAGRSPAELQELRVAHIKRLHLGLQHLEVGCG